MLRPAAILASFSCLLPVSVCAQGPDPAHREQNSSSSSSSSSSSHRVVVVNGKTVVDEHFVDGKRVPAGRVDPDPTVQDMMRRMQEWLRQHGVDGGNGGNGATSSSSHRVVVVDGKKTVDERTVDGKPVPADRRAGADAGDTLRDLEERLHRDGQPKAGGADGKRPDARPDGSQRADGSGLHPRDPVKPAPKRTGW